MPSKTTLRLLTEGTEIRINGRRAVFTVTKSGEEMVGLRGARGASYDVVANRKHGCLFFCGRAGRSELIESVEVF